MNNNLMGINNNMNNNLMGMNTIPNVDNTNIFINNEMNKEQLIDQQNMKKIKKIIEPFEERIKELEEKIRQKDLEIIFLKFKYKYNDNSNNNNFLLNYNPKNNQFMNNIFLQNNIEYENKENLVINFRLKNKNNISILCKTNDKINDVVNKFCAKSSVKKNSYIFLYKKKQIDINSNEEVGKFGLINDDQILVVEKNENQKDINSENDDSFEVSKNSDNSSNENEEEKVTIMFNATDGLKTNIILSPKKSINQLLLLFLKKIIVKEAKNLAFLYNGLKLSFDDDRTIENVMGSINSSITVINSMNVFGA